MQGQPSERFDSPEHLHVDGHGGWQTLLQGSTCPCHSIGNTRASNTRMVSFALQKGDSAREGEDLQKVRELANAQVRARRLHELGRAWEKGVGGFTNESFRIRARRNYTNMCACESHVNTSLFCALHVTGVCFRRWHAWGRVGLFARSPCRLSQTHSRHAPGRGRCVKHVLPNCMCGMWSDCVHARCIERSSSNMPRKSVP